MFTGLVEALGKIDRVEVEPSGTGRRLSITWPKLDGRFTMGESIAVNGCCLTLVAHAGETFEVQAGPETLARTNLGDLQADHFVNLERSLRVGDRLGGHFVQGHVDTTATLSTRRREGEWEFLRLLPRPRLGPPPRPQRLDRDRRRQPDPRLHLPRRFLRHAHPAYPRGHDAGPA